MKDKFSIANLKYISKIWSVLVYLILFIVVVLLFAGRSFKEIQIEFLMKELPGFYSHISNFVISFELCLVVGYLEVWFKQSLKGTIIFAGFLLLANFIYEWFVSVLNTPDKIDAYYGFAGSLSVFLYHFLNLKFGLMVNPMYKPFEKIE